MKIPACSDAQTDSSVVSRTVICVIVGVVLSLWTAWDGAAFMAGGHGSYLPVKLFVAPFGLGLLAWPTMFAAAAVSTKHLNVGLAITVAVIASHASASGITWFLSTAERELLGDFVIRAQPELWEYSRRIIVIELACPLVVLTRLLWTKIPSRRGQ